MTTDLLNDPLLSNVPVHEGYKVLGGVVLYQKLGRGGMGAVYRGRHLRLDIDVALKVAALPPGTPAEQTESFLKRFIREARTAAAVRHPNLIRVYDVNSEAGVHYLIMDYVDGESAADRMERKGRLSEQEAVEIALGAAEGLAAAHSQGIVHRDVKPDNILIDKKGSVVVADLGLAKAFGAGEGDAALSMGISLTQQAMGTPYYMSPEQTRSAKDVGPAADVWSLGVTLYQLVSGELPWRDTDLTDLINRIRNDPPLDVRRHCDGLSDGLCRIIERALSKGAAGRYADCGQIAEALRAHLDSIKQSSRSVLPDAEAGATKLVLVRVTPPIPQTMTLIAGSALGSTPLEPQSAGSVSAKGEPAHLEPADERIAELQESDEAARAQEDRRPEQEVLRREEGGSGQRGRADQVGGLAEDLAEELAERKRREEEVRAKIISSPKAAPSRTRWNRWDTALLAVLVVLVVLAAVSFGIYLAVSRASMPQPEDRADLWRYLVSTFPPDDPELSKAYHDHMGRAFEADRKAEFSEAILHYNKVIEICPEDTTFYLKRGWAKTRNGSERGAIEDHKRAFQLEPYSVSDWGNLQYKVRDWDLAIYYYDIAIQLDPGDAHSYYFRGWAKKAKGDKRGAREDFEAARRLGYSGHQ